MHFRHMILAATVVLGAAAASMAATQIWAAQDPILSYCPSHPGAVDCGTAVKMFLQFAHPNDDELVTIIKTVVAELNSGHESHSGYADTAAALDALAGAIQNPGERDLATILAETVAANDRLHPPSVEPDSAADAASGFGHHNGNSTFGGSGKHPSGSNSSSSSGEASSSGASGNTSSGTGSSGTGSGSSGTGSGSSGTGSGSSGTGSSTGDPGGGCEGAACGGGTPDPGT